MHDSRLEGGKGYVQLDDNLFMTDIMHGQNLAFLLFVYPTLCLLAAMALFTKERFKKYAYALVILPVFINLLFAGAMYWEWQGLELNNVPAMDEMMKDAML